MMRNFELWMLRISNISVSSMFFIVVMKVVMAIGLLSIAQSLLGKSDQTLTQGPKGDLVVHLIQVKSLFI